MADPRLQWRQLSQAQPNVAGLMQGANDSLMAAGEAAKGIIASYSKGAEEKAHNELLRRTGGKTQEEITAMYQSGAFDDLNLGEQGLTDLRDTMSRRSDIDLTNSQTHNTYATARNTDASTRQTDVRTGIMGDEHSIYMRDDALAWDQDTYLRENAPDYMAAELGALNRGSDLDAIAVGGAASRPDTITGLNPQFRDGVAAMVADAQAAGIDLRITSGYRDSNVQADIVAQNMEKYGLGSRVSEWKQDVQDMGPEAAGEKWRTIMRDAGLTKFVAMPGGSQHQQGNAVDFADANGSLLRDPNSPQAKWLAENAARYGLAVPMAHEPWQVELASAREGGPAANPASPPGNRGFGGDDLIARAAASGLFKPDELRSQRTPMETAAATGDTKNRERVQTAILEQTMMVTEDLIMNNPEATPKTLVGMVRERMMNSGIPMTEQDLYAVEATVNQMLEGSPNLQQGFGPGLTPSQTLALDTDEQSAETDFALALRATQGTPEAQYQTDAASFGDLTTSVEKSKALIEQFRLMDDDFENNPVFGRDADFDPATMDQHMQKAQRELREVDPDITIDEVYALAARVFEADPWFGNSLENQVDIDAMIETLSGFSSTGGRNIAEQRDNLQRVDREMKANMTAIRQLEADLNRPAIANNPTEKARVEAQIAELRKARGDLATQLKEYTEDVDRADAEEAAAALSGAGGASVRRP